MQLTKEYADKCGFKEEGLFFTKEVANNFFIGLGFLLETKTIYLIEGNETVLMIYDFTINRLDSLLLALSEKPIIETKKTKSRSAVPMLAFIGGLVAGWESSKYKPVEICKNCFNQVGFKNCCSDSAPMLLADYLRECKKFSLEYSLLKRKYNSLSDSKKNK